MKGQKGVDAAVEHFAARSHNAWRRQFLNTHPKEKNKPRMRMREGKMVDINKPWTALDPKAQADNKRAGYAAYEAVTKHPRDREAAAAYVHRAWIKRNRGDAGLSKELFLPYARLSEEEKDKDRAHVDRMKASRTATRGRRATVKAPRAKTRTAQLTLDAATLRRMEAAAKRLSRAIGRPISAEQLIIAGAHAVAAVLEATAPARKRKR